MQTYLLIGGPYDGLSHPAPDGAESVEFPVGCTDVDYYARDSLSVGNISVVIFRHESLTSVQVLSRFVEHYRAWAVNRPGGRAG